MATAIVDRIKVIDADSHVSEPENLWTNRVSVQRFIAGSAEELMLVGSDRPAS